jgi:hypothetical protein
VPAFQSKWQILPFAGFSFIPEPLFVSLVQKRGPKEVHFALLELFLLLFLFLSEGEAFKQFQSTFLLLFLFLKPY